MLGITPQRSLVGGFVASVLVNVGLVASLANSGGLRRMLLRLDLVTPPPERAPFQISDEARFRLLPNTPAEVVFAGDSLISDGPWAELFSDVHNRGIGGDRTDGVLGRLDEILASHPRTIVFLIGSNDLSAAVPVAQIVRNYRAILTRVQTDSPATRVFVAGLLPVNPTFPRSPIYTASDVQAVNEALRPLVQEFPAAQFFDLKDQLADDNGQLRPEYSTDGLHLNIKGYLAIEGKIRTLLGGA